MIPADLRYHNEHEWVRLKGNQATVGISDFAQDALGDIVFIELPKVGTTVKAGQQIGEIESTKTTSTLYTPVSGNIAQSTRVGGGILVVRGTEEVSGNIVQVNGELKDHPEVVNSEPYGRGWMVVIELSSASEVDTLMTAAQYDAFLANQKKG